MKTNEFQLIQVSMKLLPLLQDQPPQIHLEAFAQYCAKLCVFECCGLNARDFSRIHIASYCLDCDPGKPSRVAYEIIEQAKTLNANYGTNGASGRGIVIVEINERMTGQRVDILAETLEHQTTLAIAVPGSGKAEEPHPVFVWENRPNCQSFDPLSDRCGHSASSSCTV